MKTPIDNLPESHNVHVQHWLRSNEKQSDQVRWSLYPIGMVGRWVERAEAAESALALAKTALDKIAYADTHVAAEELRETAIETIGGTGMQCGPMD